MNSLPPSPIPSTSSVQLNLTVTLSSVWPGTVKYCPRTYASGNDNAMTNEKEPCHWSSGRNRLQMLQYHKTRPKRKFPFRPRHSTGSTSSLGSLPQTLAQPLRPHPRLSAHQAAFPVRRDVLVGRRRGAAVPLHADAVQGAAPAEPAVGVHGGGARRALQALRPHRQHQVRRRRQPQPGLRRVCKPFPDPPAVLLNTPQSISAILSEIRDRRAAGWHVQFRIS
jgi:hypothetical protein